MEPYQFFTFIFVNTEEATLFPAPVSKLEEIQMHFVGKFFSIIPPESILIARETLY